MNNENNIMGSNPTPRIGVSIYEPLSIEDYYRWATHRYAIQTIVKDVRVLKRMKKLGLLDSEQYAVLTWIQSLNITPQSKATYVDSYLRWLKYAGIKPSHELLDYYHSLQRLKPRKLARIPSINTAEIVINSIKGLKSRSLLAFILETGLRLGEALAIRWGQIEGDKLVLEQSSKRSEGSIIPLSQTALEILKIIKDKNTNHHPSDRIFEINRRTVWDALSRAKKKLSTIYPDAEYVNPKNLRHLFATKLYTQTKDIIYVQRMLRHRSILTTQKYVHYAINRKNFDVAVVKPDEEHIIKELLSQGYEVALTTKTRVYLRRLKD